MKETYSLQRSSFPTGKSDISNGRVRFVFEEFLSRIAEPLSRIRALSMSPSDKSDLCLPPIVNGFGSFFLSLPFLELKNLSDHVQKISPISNNTYDDLDRSIELE